MSISLSACYGGLFLHSPIVVGACPMTMDEQTRRSLETAGAGAIVLPSLFEEQVIQWTKDAGLPIHPKEQALLNRRQRLLKTAACEDAKRYLALVNRSSTQLDIPVIASMNGYTANGWLDFAGELEAAGAAGIELNVHRHGLSEHESSQEIENQVIEAIVDIKKSISVPLFIKLDHGFAGLPHFARRLCSGAEGMVLYGRQPETDICLENLKLNTTWKLTPPGACSELIGPIMNLHSLCPMVAIAGSGGVSSSEDVIRVLLAGADVAMVTSEIYRGGPGVIRRLIDGLVKFLDLRGFPSLRALQLQRPVQFDSDEERSRYMAALSARLIDEPTARPPSVCTGDQWGHDATTS